MEIMTFFPLIWMVRSDLKERTIGLYPLIFFGLIMLITIIIQIGGLECCWRFFQNSMLLGFLTGGVVLYFKLRYRRSFSSLNREIGGGDLGFLFCLTPAFEIVQFTWFLVISLVCSACMCLFILSWRQKGVPLVSTVGVSYMIYVVFRWYLKI